jgi:nitroreductase
LNVYETIVTKRDTRRYAARPIEAETMRRILQAGRMAGSSKNTQPVRFILIQKPERLAEVAECGHFAEHLPSAAAAIAVVLEPDGGSFDAGRAAQNMMVAAWAEGITSCPTSMHERDCAHRILGLPKGHELAIVLALGYPQAGSRLGAGRIRLPLSELVHEERW